MIYKNLHQENLIRLSVANERSRLTKTGVLCTWSGKYKGRSPNAKFIVEDSITKDTIDWKNNQKISVTNFDKMYKRFIEFKDKSENLYLQEVSAVRDPDYSLPINIWTQTAKHSAYVRNMFITNKSDDFDAIYNIYHFPSLSKDPKVVISFEKRVILISGTSYSGEIKKSVFTVLNYWFPEDYGFLPMHCSVNVDRSKSNPVIFFGLSGTGKTTLSSDTNRVLLGDDEHGWTDKGLVNFEGGCYAKTVRLSKEQEPQIWNACNKKGTILENVVLKNGIPDFDDTKYTENGRASYPTSFISNADEKGYVNSHPKNIIMLTCDSFGVLPPVAKLSAEEAVRQFLMGYTSKVAGTESGITKPIATFSPCFGLPFMPLPPEKYGKILKQKIDKHEVNCWLVNTGWTGGSYGVGKRMPINITRSIINDIIDGSLAKCKTVKHKKTNLHIPITTSIPESILIPEMSWKDKKSYDLTAKNLMEKFYFKMSEIYKS